MRGILATTLTTLGVSACASLTSPTLPERDPSLPDREAYGPATIVARDAATSFSKDLPTMHVKTSTDDECGIVFTLTGETEIARRTPGGELDPARAADLRVGRVVRVWAIGDAVARSCPGQATAEAVELLPR
jgi:hypothetical protein